jgi:hypothetical protein
MAPTNLICEGEISSVNDLLDKASEKINPDNLHAHIRFYWRGHSDDDWELRPGVYRNSFNVEDNEKARLSKERQVAQDFRIESAGLRMGSETDAQLYFLQQHFGLPTRLLDWTTNALAALFFAVCDEVNTEKPGAVFLMDAYQLSGTQDGGTQEVKKIYDGIVTSRHWVFKQSMDKIFNWRDNLQFPNFVMAVRPEHFDRRISLQRSCFTFHVPTREQLTPKENSTLAYFRVPANAKGPIFKRLVLLGIDRFSVYGDLASLAGKLKTAHNIDP